MAAADEDDYISRALAAWFRAGGREHPAKTSSIAEHNGRTFVVLRSARGTLAVYRVLNRGVLKRLKRPPRPLAPDWYVDR